ncbi:immunity protein Imm33 domain-containing protein [Riemerella anatipestifer]|uniref:Imm33-like domain-containing protein n=2 Tax=Riemerella anatipestifer TaxID=34085 RepID=J9RA59_RIEAN|nr:hypothetical protein [Riemerella anatipestifer]AFR36597.1 hypothetical protein B739_2015 [Riemerella anatipestifer RA-CH-1]AIH01394.1 hypothetical protein M949_0223 [Riemerella anatipestifer CH3]AQY23079.1 hypothetical protein AB406_2142 [Riemerella anatipestifer]MBO4233100.1 hypothetical protein [Riemerella anatipestifer]MCO4304039.1 hypothetical protein [Riemerella anatipestifer]
MKISAEDLIKICDKYLDGEIDQNYILVFAENILSDENIDFENEIVYDIIIQWHNPYISFEINNLNMKLWKHYLLTGEDKLIEYNSWNIHIEPQKKICEKYNSEWIPINKKLKIGISKKRDLTPINGIRHSAEKGTTGWFIWFGDYSESPDFFEPLCAEHLLQIYPKIIDYLGLEVGYRFLIDKNGYEDVWKDEKIK